MNGAYHNLLYHNPKCLCFVFLTVRHGKTIFQVSATNYVNQNEVLAHFHPLKDPATLTVRIIISLLHSLLTPQKSVLCLLDCAC